MKVNFNKPAVRQVGEMPVGECFFDTRSTRNAEGEVALYMRIDPQGVSTAAPKSKIYAVNLATGQVRQYTNLFVEVKPAPDVNVCMG